MGNGTCPKSAPAAWRGCAFFSVSAHIANDVLSDNVALDLISAFDDLQYLRVAEVAFDRVFLRDPSRAEQLYRVCRDLHSDVGGEAFRHRRKGC